MAQETSAPGKVLIIGGYLVVEYPNISVSIGTTARFRTRIVSSKVSTNRTCRVRILSPQFGKEFSFECTVATEPEVSVTVNPLEGPDSPFLCNSVLYAVAVSFAHGSDVFRDVTLELLADNDFYSQRNYLESQAQPVTAASLRSLPPHLALVGEVSKTGLGSSAAMTTSVVSSLCHFFKSNRACEIETIHRIAQIAHSAAQGKIGSGFDVHTAAYGSSVYRRFPACRVSRVVRGGAPPRAVAVAALLDAVGAAREWARHEPFRLPTGLQLALGDVHRGGSGTPGMVAKVMAWREDNAGTANKLWEALRECNEKYIEALRALIQHSRDNTAAHNEAIGVLSRVVFTRHMARNESEQLWIDASATARASRQYLREIGEAAGVAIEPKEITALLDATAAIPGVFAVGCPGAGGYDAVFALILSDTVRSAVEKCWETYKAMDVCPLLVREDTTGLIVS